MVDGELLVRQLASPLRGGETVRRFEVGVLLAEEVVLNGAIDNTIRDIKTQSYKVSLP